MIWFALFALTLYLSHRAYLRYVSADQRRDYAKKSPQAWFPLLLVASMPLVGFVQFCVEGSALVPLTGRLNGIVWMLAGYALQIWAFRSNRFISPIVEMPARIAIGGAYRFCHHPQYGGCALVAIGQFLLLAQSWMLIPVGVYLLFLLNRIRLENRLLYGLRIPT